MALTKITPQMFDTSAAGHDFNIDNGTFVVDASANRVGIGTTTPSTLLDVDGTATATTFVGALTGNVTGNVTGTILTAAQTNITSVGTLTGLALTGNITLTKTSADALLKIVTGGGNDAILELDAPGASGAQSRIIFSDSGTVAGSIIYAHNSGGTDYMTFGTGGNNTTALTLDSSQNATFAGAIQSTSEIRNIGSSGSVNNRLKLTYDSTNGTALIGPDSNGGSTTLALGTSNSGTYANALKIDASQNVGIGAATPAFGSGSGLEVSRSGTATVRVERTGSTASSGEFFAGNGKWFFLAFLTIILNFVQIILKRCVLIAVASYL